MTRGLTLVFLVLAALAVALVSALALFGDQNLLLAALKDDGFYFLALARNLAHGHGATFDGLGPTNGFHPIWLLLLTPIFWIPWPSIDTPIRAMLFLSLGLHLVAAAVLERIGRRLGSASTARLTALAYVANPLVLYLVISGMESPVVALVTALLTLEVIRLVRAEVPPDRREAIRFGVLAGLCVLARTDLVLLSGCAMAAVLLLAGRAGEAAPAPFALGGRWAARAWFLARSTGVAAIVISPWVGWNLWRFGSLVQVSARAHHLHSVSLRAPGEPEGVARRLTAGASLLSSVTRTLAARAGVPVPVIGLLLVAIVAVLAWWLWAQLARREQRSAFLERGRLLAAPTVYAVGFLLAAFFFLGHIRSWYLAGPLTVGGMLLVLPLDPLLRPRTLSQGGRVASALIVAGLVLSGTLLGLVFSREIVQNGRTLPVWKEASAWAVAHTSGEERVASFNSGTFGYLAPRTVINLDCVVNNRALPFLEQRRLLEFLHREQVRYVIDDRWYATRYFGDYAGPDWRDWIVPVDTLTTGLIAYRVRQKN